MTALKAEQICKITDHKILDDVNFTALPGEIHAIIGNNGEGKSTFAKVLSGIELKSSGTLYVNDQEVSISNIKTAQKLGIYMVQQDVQLYPSLTVRDNILCGNETAVFSSKFFTPSRKRLSKFCEEILERFDLHLDLNRTVSTLSEGELHLIQLIRVLICKPAVLILDEFSTALTFKESEMVFDILKKLKEENVSILLITHSFNEILRYCDKVSIMSEGTITATYSNSQNGYKDQSFLAQMKKLSMDFKYPKLLLKPGRRLLDVDHISVGILKEVTLTLHEGEILGIAGLVGSGRSTLLKAIMGHVKIQSGSIYYEPPLDSPDSISVVQENSANASLFNECSIPFNIVASNFRKTKRKYFLSNGKTNTYARNYIDKLNISDTSIHSRVKHLSMGNKQKILVARSLFNRSKVYIFDEASKNLDPTSKLELYNIFNALVLEGAAIIMISSDFSELVGMCNRIILLSKGVQIGEYSTDHLSIDALYEKF